MRFEPRRASRPPKGMTPKTASPPSTMKIWIVDLDEREEELALREEPRREDVHAEDQEAVDEAPEPDGRVREPVLHAEACAQSDVPTQTVQVSQ